MKKLLKKVLSSFVWTVVGVLLTETLLYYLLHIKDAFSPFRLCLSFVMYFTAWEISQAILARRKKNKADKNTTTVEPE